MVADATSAIEILATFQRQVADTRCPDQVVEQLGTTLANELGLAVLILATNDEGDPAVAFAHALEPEIEARLQDVQFLDSVLGHTLTRDLEDDWHANTWLMVSAGSLFGAAVVFHHEPMDPIRGALAQSLVDASALALDRIHTTQSLEDTIEELRLSEAELARAHTLEALGKMAAVIAHEVRNPLASIGGVLQILRNRFPEDSTDRQMFEKVLLRLADLNQLLTEILGFARPQKTNRSPLDLHALVLDAVGAFEADPAHAEVDVDVKVARARVAADSVLMRGVLDNLLLNASQAMEDRGAIRVGVEDLGGRCALVIDDSGPGVPIQIRETLFEPFVTTKTKGTGLGLAMVARVVQGHDGTIEVGEAPSGGARFTVVLPTV